MVRITKDLLVQFYSREDNNSGKVTISSRRLHYITYQNFNNKHSLNFPKATVV